MDSSANQKLNRKVERKLTVLFGTIEYFKREIYQYLGSNRFDGASEDPLSIISAKLENEVLYDFICDEKIRLECLNNLKSAIEKIAKELVFV